MAKPRWLFSPRDGDDPYGTFRYIDRDSFSPRDGDDPYNKYDSHGNLKFSPRDGDDPLALTFCQVKIAVLPA